MRFASPAQPGLPVDGRGRLVRLQLRWAGLPASGFRGLCDLGDTGRKGYDADADADADTSAALAAAGSTERGRRGAGRVCCAERVRFEMACDGVMKS